MTCRYIARRVPVEHELKVWPEFYGPAHDGVKPFEIRKNDRDYRIGDILVLREFDPATACYTGNSLRRVVTYVTDFGQVDGMVVLGIRPEAELSGRTTR